MFYGMNAWFLATLVLGAHLWVAAISLPALRRAAPDLASKVFLSSWSRGAPVLTAVTTVSICLGVVASVDDSDFKWAVGSAFLALALLFAALFTHPLAGRLLDAEAPLPHSETVPLLLRWSRMHLARVALFGVGVFFFIWAAH